MKRALLLALVLAGCSKEEPTPAAAKPVDPNAPEKVLLISKGLTYSTSDYLVPGYVTILDFYADW